MRRTLPEQEQNRRLRDALDPSPDGVFARPDPPTNPRVTTVSPHTCKRHMYAARIPAGEPVALG